ncbi:MAG: chromosomal replication initiator protein DnaA [Verrucomicrobia bacterium]|nr:chromosomal replication initiator protein DnaA [Verrucomicrobiota bacterium]
MENTLRRIWEEIANGIRPHVSPDAFQRWFAALELVQTDEAALVLQVPNTIYQLWIESNYLSLVHGAVASVLGSPREIRFVVAETERAPAPAAEPTEPEPAAAAAAAGAGGGGGTVTASPDGVSPDGITPDGASARLADKDAEVASTHGMNPRNTFDTFVVGSNNQFAHAAALAVAQSPAKTYNPLFMFGDVGLGKTHLMHAIGQQVLERKKGVKVMYLSSEKFTNEFIDAIQHNTLVKFRKRYRQADILLIDDIHFLAGKERSQEEFFHTFNTLFDGRKQIVLSSDRPPTEITNLEQRLVSRFEWGLTAELQPPDIETRLAILRKKAQALHVQLAPEVLDFLAQRVRTNVRRLEGALMRVASYASLSGREVSQDAVEQLLRDILQEEARKTITIDQIQRKVAEHFDVRLADMTSKRRPANIAFPRQVAMYLARRHTKASLNEIGDAFGGRDHGTVLHACKTVQNRMTREDQTRQLILLLDNLLDR